MKNILKIALLGCMLVGATCTSDASVTTKKNVMPVEITPVLGYELISLAEAKQHLRIEADFTDEDTDLQNKINGAISIVQDYLYRGNVYNAVFVETQNTTNGILIKDWRDALLVSVKIKYDGDAEFTDLPTENYQVLYKGAFGPGVFFNDIDVLGVDEIRTEYSLTVPPSVKSAAFLVLGDLYEYREDRGDVNARRMETLLKPHRNYGNGC